VAKPALERLEEKSTLSSTCLPFRSPRTSTRAPAILLAVFSTR
jgi:hypothetical protein